MCANFRIMPEKEFPAYLCPNLIYLISAVRYRSFEIVRNKNWCILSSTGNVNLLFGFNNYVILVLMILFNHCHTKNFLRIGLP